MNYEHIESCITLGQSKISYRKEMAQSNHLIEETLVKELFSKMLATKEKPTEDEPITSRSH